MKPYPPFDTSPLVTGPSSDLAAYTTQCYRAGKYTRGRPMDPDSNAGHYLGHGLAGGFLSFALAFFLSIPWAIGGFISWWVVLWASFSLTVLGALAGLVVAFFQLRKPKEKAPWWLRMASFAELNQLRFQASDERPHYPGTLFRVGTSGWIKNAFVSDSRLFAGAGTYSYREHDEEDAPSFSWRYAAFRLPQAVPHLLLDRVENDSDPSARLPFKVDSYHRVELGYPFDQHYRAFAPSGYSVDTFYFLPPDVMQELIALPALVDVEMIGQWVFCYWRTGLKLEDAETWKFFHRVEHKLVLRLHELASRYREPLGLQSYNDVTPELVAVVSDAKLNLEGRKSRQKGNYFSVIYPLYLIYFFVVSGLIYFLGK